MSEFSSWDTRSGWFGLEIPPIGAKFGKHHCLYCGHELTLKKIRCEEEFYEIKEVYRFCCSNCKKVISPITQLSFEDHEKRVNRINNLLLEFVKSEQIKNAWVDKNNNIIKSLDIEKLDGFFFWVIFSDKKFQISCSRTKRMKSYYEYPIKIIKDRNFKKTFAELKRNVGRFCEK